MTPTELVDLIRQRHNVVGDNFWSDNEILSYVYDACQQLAREALVIEDLTTQTTTSGTRSYAFPTRVIAIKRIEYNGIKLQPTNFRQDDLLTGLNADSTATGTPTYYSIWADTIYLRPIPDSSSATLRIYVYKEPTTLDNTSTTLEVPAKYHADLADYAIGLMCAKEKNYEGSKYWLASWQQRLMRAKQWERKKKRADAFGTVLNLDSINDTFIGYT